MLIKLCLSGGLFALLAFVHFFVDWLFQSHSSAMIKHNHFWVRAKHCVIYTIGFVPVMYLIGYSLTGWLVCLSVLFISHMYLDTYHLVYIWAKYIRKPPEMANPWKEEFKNVDGRVQARVHAPDPKVGFVRFVETGLGKILMIAVDQISHLLFLWVLVYFAIWR
jgi:hypothetical protein